MIEFEVDDEEDDGESVDEGSTKLFDEPETERDLFDDK